MSAGYVIYAVTDWRRQEDHDFLVNLWGGEATWEKKKKGATCDFLYEYGFSPRE